MTRIGFLLLILFSLTISSCTFRKNRIDNKSLIPEKELTTILTDIYITDGLLNFSKIYDWYPSLDSLSSYYHIIEKHGYSKELMDKTMEFYFIKKPKKLINIYDQVLGNLSEMESLFEKESLLTTETLENLWPGKKSYSFPDLSDSDSTFFDVILKRRGIYSFKFTATLFPDDQSYNPRITLYSSHPDSTKTGKRNYIGTINYIKDGRPHKYSLSLNALKTKKTQIRGYLYDFDNHPDKGEKHIMINNISLTRN
jgi:Domain of unknown function (DUF4296)